MSYATSGALENFGFQDYMTLQAEATHLDGFVVRQDFNNDIGRYLRNSDDVRLWPLLKKKPAEADLNREAVEDADPASGFVSKTNPTPPETSTSFAPYDLTDPGQQNKALGGIISVGHYATSLWEQQGKPYGPQLAEKTNKLISSMCKKLERALFKGNATNNPLEFNGLEAQMKPDHRFYADMIAGDRISQKLRSVTRLAVSDENVLRGVTHIFCSALGVELLEDQTESQLEYSNLDRVTPGLRVPSIVTARGVTPLVDSPFLRDTPSTESGEPHDWVHYYLLDINSLCWRGVIPKGGEGGKYEPQIFDVSRYQSGNYLVEKRMGLMYGTLHALNRGEGIWKLSLKVPAGTIGGI